jgi:hypothetical protein
MKHHYAKILQGLLEIGAHQLSLTPEEAKEVLRDFETLKTLRELSHQVPCELCAFKSGSNIEENGGCRHKPLVDARYSYSNDHEVIRRFQSLVDKK